MNYERIVLTTFAGYFFTQILCLRSIQQYAPGIPIDIIIDDFDIQRWPTYPDDCQKYITENFPNLHISFNRFSNFPGMEKVKTGGWFRQQLVKLYLDQFAPADRWLLVDADVVFLETPKLSNVSAVVRNDPHPVDVGNRLYVGFMLGTDTPWVVNENQYWCLSGVPYRYLTRELLMELRAKVEQLHNKSMFQLHLDLFESNDLVAYDPDSKKMIMSEFQLIEVFRDKYFKDPLPITMHKASKFSHTSIKDWNLERSMFEEQIIVPDTYWDCLLTFGKHHA